MFSDARLPDFAGLDTADDLELGHVDDVDGVGVAAGHIQLRAVLAEVHVAGAARCFYGARDLEGLGVEHEDRVRFLGADEHETGALT